MTVTLGAACVLLLPPSVQALGFGRTVTATTLGQPLNFTAAVALDASESLTRECVFANVFAGDAKVPPPNVRIALETARDGIGRSVRVSTMTLIDEPVVTVEITIGCASSVSRRFVTFIDPPLINLAEAPSAVMPQEAVSQVAPLVEISRAADAAARRPVRNDSAATATNANTTALPRTAERRAAARAARAQRQAIASAAARSSPSQREPSRRTARLSSGNGGAVVTTSPNRGAPRLQLEAPPPRVAVASSPAATPATPLPAVVAAAVPVAPGVVSAPASASAGTGASDPAALASADASAEALARERERIQVLEAGMARLGNDAQAMQKSVATLQARLREAESDRYANKLVYALAAGLIFFALLSAAIWAVRPRQRQRARWFDANANQAARAKRNPSSSAMPPAPSPRESGAAPLAGTRSWTGGPPSILPVTAPATIGGLEVTTVISTDLYRPLNTAAMALSASSEATPQQAGKRGGSMSMEELIDLEQQAEFFVVLGQDEAAIDLLDTHIRDGAGASPLPYLKLLEIHQRRRDRAAYEDVRESFKEQFNAFAPEWSADLQFGRALDDYPQTIARLQALWPTPMQAMQTLDGLLFRRNGADEAFDFPAYRELLFLYSIARELAGHVETDFGSIDLFLPLDDAAAETEPMVTGHDIHTIDLDVSTWGDASTEELVIRRAPGRLGKS